jgi:serine/threonine-protein kinase
MACPSEEELRTLLDGSCAAEQAVPMTEHLEACAACRTKLDRLAGANDSWPALAERLKEGQTPSAPALQQAMEQLREPPGEAGPTPTVQAPLGEAMLGRYQLRDLVGVGGMGRVYRAFDEGLHRVVAIKVMADSLAASGPARQRFLREARAAAAVVHENVVVIHEVNDSGEAPYLVMQFVSGQSLQERIDKDGPLPLKDILRIAVQTAQGLAAAHAQGLVHRDVKPANVLLENGLERVKLTDFGLARAVDDASLTQSGVFIGTPQYVSPEQANGEHVDHRSDLFSLGSVLYAMATGHAPFRAGGTMAVLKRVCEEAPRPIREANPELPEWLERVVAKLMAKDPKDRYQSADEAAEVLAAALARAQSGGAPAPRSEPARRTKRTAWPAGLAAAVVLLAGAFVVAAALWKQKQPRLSEPAPQAGEEPQQKGQQNPPEWVQLFNGRDLTGWRTHPKAPGDWYVEGGIVTSRQSGFLFSESRWGDFHLRVEALFESGGDGGVFIRSPFRMCGRPVPLVEDYCGCVPESCEVELSQSWGKQVGGLHCWREGGGGPLRRPPESAAKPGQWLTLEVIAVGAQVLTKIDGKPTAHLHHLPRDKGYVVLQALGPDASVRFRKVEIMELTAGEHPELPLARWGDPIDPRGDCTFAAEGDRLTVTVPAGVHNLVPFGLDGGGQFGKRHESWDNQDAPRLLREVEGDFAAQVKLVDFPPRPDERWPDLDESAQGGGLLVWQDGEHFLQLRGGRAGDGTPKSSEPRGTAWCWAGGKLLCDKGGEAHPYLRVARRGRTLACDTSQDGKTWRTLATVAGWDLPPKLRVGVVAINSAPRPFTSTFEGYRLGR